MLMFLSRGCVASLRSRQPSPWPPVLPSACRARAHAPCRPGCSYFASKNVLVEVEASVNEQKPLVLSNFSSVQEGGVELETAVAECPAQFLQYIFGTEGPAAGSERGRWPIIPWVRHPDFEIQCLRQILAATLRGLRKSGTSSAARANSALEEQSEDATLYLPRDLISRMHWRVASGVELVYSRANPGVVAAIARLVAEHTERLGVGVYERFCTGSSRRDSQPGQRPSVSAKLAMVRHSISWMDGAPWNERTAQEALQHVS